MKSELYFGLGAVVGAACTWYFSKKYYERIANEEIASVKEVFKNHHLTPIKEDAKEKAKENREKPSIMEYSNILKREGYTDYSGTTAREEKGEDKVKRYGKDVPYVISPEDFGDDEDYEKISYTYYSDGVVTTNNDNEIVRDPGDVLGEDFADHFGDYEDDSVYICNDVTGCYYEVLYDDRTFEEAVGPRSEEEQ